MTSLVVSVAWMLAQPPCLPVELGRLVPAPEALPPVPPPTAPAPMALPDSPPLPVPLRRKERIDYRVAFGLLGKVGEVTIQMSPEPAPILAAVPGAPPPASSGARTVQLTGRGAGSLLGLGHTEKTIDSELDAGALETRRWKSQRIQGDKIITDFAQQNVPGNVALVRRRPGKPDSPDTLTRKASVMDPLGFLFRLRVAPPTTAPQTFEVLDGRGLWLLTVNPPTKVTAGTQPRALRLDGKAQPIYWDGSADTERSARSFSIWLSDDEFRTPLRLVMPMAIGEVNVELVSLSRAKPPALLRFPVLSMRAIHRWLSQAATAPGLTPAPSP